MPKRARIPWTCWSVSMSFSQSVAGSSTRNLNQCASKPAHLFDRIVVHQRCSDSTALAGKPRSLHQPRRIHVAIAHADILFGKLFGDFCRRHIRQVETQSWDSFMDSILAGDAIDHRAALVQYPKHFERKRFFVSSDALKCMLQSDPPRFQFL